MFTLTSRSSTLATVNAFPVPPSINKAQQGVQSTDRAGPVRGDLMITISQQPQHDSVFIETGDDVQHRVVPRDDRCRPGVVRVGLVDLAALEKSNTRRQLRWHINDMLTGRDQLLGKHRTHPGRTLDRPRPWREPCRPRQQACALITVRVDTDRVDHHLRLVDRGCGVRTLVRVDADHEHDVLQC